MLIYLLLPILNIIFYIILSKFKVKKNIYLISSLTILMIISSFRASQIGADYHVYVNVFENIDKAIISYPMEKGYLLLNYIVALITSNYVIFALIINLFIFSAIYKYIKNNVDEKYYLWIILIFTMNPYLYIQSTFNVIRQTIAFCIILYGIKYLIEKKYIIYILLILMAAQFHSISYIFILLIFIRMMRWNEKKFFILLFCVILLVLFKNCGIIDFFAKILGYGKYAKYGATMFDFFVYHTFIISVVSILILNYKKIEIKENEKFFLDTYIISLSLLPVFVTNDIMYRVYIGFIFISLPAVPLILKHCDKTMKKMKYLIKSGYALYYSLLFVMFLYSIMKTNNINYIPFRFFWQ